MAFAINLYMIILFSPGLFGPEIFLDNGTMSVLNMLLILTAWVLCLIHFMNSPGQRIRWFCWLYIIQLYLFREADFHRAFFDIHVTKAAFYISDHIPLWQKVIVIIIMAGLPITVVYTLISSARCFWRALMKGEAWFVSLLLWIVFLLCSQILFDKTDFNEHPSWKVRSIEEMMEVVTGFYAVAAVSLYTIRQWCTGKE